MGRGRLTMQKNKATIEDLIENNKQLGKALDELREKHRKVKYMLLHLLERIPVPNTTKEKISDMVFDIFKEVK